MSLISFLDCSSTYFCGGDQEGIWVRTPYRGRSPINLVAEKKPKVKVYSARIADVRNLQRRRKEELIRLESFDLMWHACGSLKKFS
ncbi:hypothetical protein U1Q18_032222 [Sarracenia purpurea var. burkii]